MPLSIPAVSAPGGTETFDLFQEGSFRTVTLAQLRNWVLGNPIGSGAANPPTARPAPPALAGTDQLQVCQQPAWRIATLDQLKAWATDDTFPAFARPASGRTLSFPAVSALSDTDAIGIQQGGGSKQMTLDILAAWLAA